MAIYHLSTKPIKRSSGRSATASAAYRAGVEISDKRTGLTHDYTKRSGVVLSDCFAMQGNEKVGIDRSQLWNAAEAAEKRKDGRTAREIVINLPHELNEQQRTQLVDDFAQSIAKQYRCAVDYAIHTPDKQGDQRNHHAHIMVTTRHIEIGNHGVKLGNKTALELSNRKLKELDLPKTQDQIKQMRKDWAEHTNRMLEKNGLDLRIDHRSHKERGLELQPTVKMGWQASAMERRGITTDKGDLNRQIKADNQQRVVLQAELSAFKEAESEIALAKEQAQSVQDFKSEYEQFKQQMQAEKQAQLDKQQELEKPNRNDRGMEL